MKKAFRLKKDLAWLGTITLYSLDGSIVTIPSDISHKMTQKLTASIIPLHSEPTLAHLKSEHNSFHHIQTFDRLLTVSGPIGM